MKLLLIESTPGNAQEIGAQMVAEGHEVLTCADEHGGPCRGIDEHVACPMEQHIDLTIVAREPGSTHTLGEMGSVCAQRHRVPMVEVDPRQVDDELPSVKVANAVAKRAVEAGYATAIRHELGHLPALVDVDRSPGRIHVSVQVPASEDTPQKLSAIADRARHAVRAHDPYISGIDVSVVCYPDPA
jgi:hypothetical protein